MEEWANNNINRTSNEFIIRLSYEILNYEISKASNLCGAKIGWHDWMSESVLISQCLVSISSIHLRCRCMFNEKLHLCLEIRMEMVT